MSQAFEIYTDDLWVCLPSVAIFVLIFSLVMRSLREMDMFPAASRLVIGLCVTTLAMYGMDRAVIRPILASYSAMGVAMLISLAVLLLATWIGIVVKGRKKL